MSTKDKPFKLNFLNINMEKYVFLEHTADAKFQAFGKNLEEAFANSALAMFSIVTDPEKVEGKIEKGINVRGKDLKQLLYNFLEEALFFLETEFFLLHKVKNLTITKISKEYILKAVFEGDKISKKYEIIEDIKAMTYSEMIIKEEKEKCIIQVVVDL